MSDDLRPPQLPTASGDRFDILRASKDLFADRLSEIMRRCGIDAPAVLKAFACEIGEAHDQLASVGPRDDFDQISQLTASRLTLMGDDELELDIRMREIGARLREAGGRALGRCCLRYMTLLSRPAMIEDNNPVGVETICMGLWVISRKSGGSLTQTIGLLDGIERRLRQEVPALYREIDELLANYGIEPARGQRTSGGASVDPGAQQTPDGEPAQSNPLSTLQQVVSQRLGGEPLANPIPFTGGIAARSGNASLDAAAMVMLNHLLDRLTALESRSIVATSTAVDLPPNTPPHTVKAKDLDLPLGKPEAITLDTMALIFEAIFDSDELPAAIKAAIGRLQIPLLKLAIVDPSLFANDQHPARLVVNRMARAAIGLPRDVAWEHPICKRIAHLTTTVRNAIEEKCGTLEPPLAELEALILERDESIRRDAEPHVQLVVEYEDRQHAEQAAETWLRTKLSETSSPELASFLERFWLRVMTAAALDGGDKGERWQQDGSTGDELIWSVQPKQNADERKRLAGVASSLVRRIGAGLDAIGVSAAEKTPWLNTLFDLQTAALRGQPQPRPASPEGCPEDSRTRNGSADRRAKRAVCTLERDGRRVHHLATPADAGSTYRTAARGWQLTDWLSFRLPDETPLCGLCCWLSPTSGTVLLFNPDWGYAVAMPSAAVDQQIRSGHARVISRTAIFDAAAERALGQLDKR